VTNNDWLTAAKADAGRRGLPQLEPLLKALAAATRALRAAEWNQHAAMRPRADPPAPSDDAPAI
jgi:hypothetical protein